MLSRDRQLSPVFSKYQNRMKRSAEEIVGLAASAANHSKNWRTNVQRVIWTPSTLFFDSLDTQKFSSGFADDDNFRR